MEKKTYDVLINVTHDGKNYPAGKSIALDEEAAAPLLAVNAIAAPAKPEKKGGTEK